MTWQKAWSGSVRARQDSPATLATAALWASSGRNGNQGRRTLYTRGVDEIGFRRVADQNHGAESSSDVHVRVRVVGLDGHYPLRRDGARLRTPACNLDKLRLRLSEGAHEPHSPPSQPTHHDVIISEPGTDQVPFVLEHDNQRREGRAGSHRWDHETSHFERGRGSAPGPA